MNVFDAIYFNETDPVKRAFIAAETALDIAVSQTLKDFAYESGLVDLSNDSVFSESGDNNTKKENIFVRTIKGIFNAIRSFISSVIDTIGGFFDNRKSITSDEYLKSDSAKKQLENDINKLDKTVDGEILKGKKLIQKASSATGLPDSEIDSWVKIAIDKIKAVAPVVGPMVAAVGLNKLISFLRNKNKTTNECEKMAIDGSANLSPSQQKQRTKIANGFHKIIKSAINPITKIVEGSHKVSDKKYMEDRRNQSNSYKAIESEYLAGNIKDEEYLSNLRALGTIDKEIEREFGIREAERRARIERDKAIRSLGIKALKKINNEYKSGKITKDNANGFKQYIDALLIKYSSSSHDATSYESAVKGLKNHILNR